jgi:hypothetical protein
MTKRVYQQVWYDVLDRLEASGTRDWDETPPPCEVRGRCNGRCNYSYASPHSEESVATLVRRDTMTKMHGKIPSLRVLRRAQEHVSLAVSESVQAPVELQVEDPVWFRVRWEIKQVVVQRRLR